MYIYIYIYCIYIHVCESADLFQSESVLDYIVIKQYLAILRLSRHQIIAIPCNIPSCRLQSTYTIIVLDNFLV